MSSTTRTRCGGPWGEEFASWSRSAGRVAVGSVLWEVGFSTSSIVVPFRCGGDEPPRGDGVWRVRGGGVSLPGDGVPRYVKGISRKPRARSAYDGAVGPPRGAGER